MEVTIYVLGDLGTFRAVLQSVAMVFNDPILSNNGALGIGSAAVLGLLITLLWVLGKGMLAPMGRGEFNPAIVLVLLIVYYAMAVPKVHVQLEDIYTGNIAAVDGVPVGIAYPGAVISAITRNITTKVETAFSGVDGNYISLSAQGFTSPLRLLLAMRKGVENVDPYLAANLKMFMIDCVAGSPDFKQGDFARSLNAVAYMLANRRDGLTVYFTPAHPDGESKACAESANLLGPAVDAFLAGSQMTRLLNANIPVRATPNTATPGQWTAPDAEAVQHNLVATAFGTAQSASDFMQNALFAGMISDSYNCASRSFNHAEYNQCMITLVQASEQWKTDATAGGSMFQKTMIPSMNILLLLFYAFAPMMFVFMMMAGWHGLNVLMKYLIFGVWTQTWLPFAAIINYIIQVQTVDELRRVGVASTDAVGKGLTVAVLNPFYDVLSTKLAVASEMLAATPLITLALMTGSIYGLVSMAQRMSGRDYVNEKQASPDLHQPAPMSMGKPQYSGVPGGAVADHLGNPGWSGTLGNVRGRALESAKGEVDSASRQLTETGVKMLQSGHSQGVNVKDATQHMDERGVTRSSSFEAVQQKMSEVGRSMGLSAEQSKEFGRQATIGASLGWSSEDVMFGALKNLTGVRAGAKGGYEINGKTVSRDSIKSAYDEKTSDSTTRRHVEAVQRQIAEKTTDTQGYEKLLGRQLTDTETQSWQAANAHLQQTQSSYRSLETAASSFNGSNTLGGEQIANAMLQNRGGVRGELMSDDRGMRDDIGDEKWERFMTASAAYHDARGSQFEGTLTGGERRDSIRFHALRMASESGDMSARRAAGGRFLGAVARVAGESPETVARLAEVQPAPLGLKVNGPSAQTEFQAEAAGSAAESFAGGTRDKVDAAVAAGGPAGVKDSEGHYNTKFNLSNDQIQRQSRTMEVLTALQGAKGRAAMVRQINADSIGGQTLETYLGQENADIVRKYTGLGGRDQGTVDGKSVLLPPRQMEVPSRQEAPAKDEAGPLPQPVVPASADAPTPTPPHPIHRQDALPVARGEHPPVVQSDGSLNFANQPVSAQVRPVPGSSGTAPTVGQPGRKDAAPVQGEAGPRAKAPVASDGAARGADGTVLGRDQETDKK